MPQPMMAVDPTNMLVPFVDEPSRADPKAIAAVRVPDLEDRSRHRLRLGDQEFQATVHGLDHREQRDRPMLHRHLDGQAASDEACNEVCDEVSFRCA